MQPALGTYMLLFEGGYSCKLSPAFATAILSFSEQSRETARFRFKRMGMICCLVCKCSPSLHREPQVPACARLASAGVTTVQGKFKREIQGIPTVLGRHGAGIVVRAQDRDRSGARVPWQGHPLLVSLAVPKTPLPDFFIIYPLSDNHGKYRLKAVLRQCSTSMNVSEYHNGRAAVVDHLKRFMQKASYAELMRRLRQDCKQTEVRHKKQTPLYLTNSIEPCFVQTMPTREAYAKNDTTACVLKPTRAYLPQPGLPLQSMYMYTYVPKCAS